MNPHHLELFYFVAKYKGITEAVRKMPYGIQQPAVSGQILQLEKNLGVKLFRRRPFALTPAGEELFEFVYPFFSQVEQVADRISGEENQHLRLAASATALTNHLPNVLLKLRDECPGLRLTLRELNASEVETALQKQEADVAVAVMPRRTAAGVKGMELFNLSVSLLAPSGCPANRFENISEGAVGGHIQEPLVAVPGNEAAARAFQSGLSQLGLTWDTTMEVSEISLIEKYVAGGFGFGLAVDIPGVEPQAAVKRIPLPDEFPKLPIGLLHGGSSEKRVAQRFMALAKEYAGQLGQNRSKQSETH